MEWNRMYVVWIWFEWLDISKDRYLIHNNILYLESQSPWFPIGIILTQCIMYTMVWYSRFAKIKALINFLQGAFTGSKWKKNSDLLYIVVNAIFIIRRNGRKFIRKVFDACHSMHNETQYSALKIKIEIVRNFKPSVCHSNLTIVCIYCQYMHSLFRHET